MKRLKTTVEKLRRIFEECITLRYIAERLVSYDINCSASEVKEEMGKKNFDIVGVSKNGKIIGYVENKGISELTLKKYYKRFPKQLLIREEMPMLPGIHLLVNNPYVITMRKKEYHGIITRGDLQKAPIRMWLFGLISMLEMHFQRIIQFAYPDDSWKQLLTPNRVTDINKTFSDNKIHNVSLELIDCLQWSDKKVAIMKSGLYKNLHYVSKSKFETQCDAIRELRDNLAHSQNLNARDWPELIKLAQEIEKLIVSCENIDLLTLHK